MSIHTHTHTRTRTHTHTHTHIQIFKGEAIFQKTTKTLHVLKYQEVLDFQGQSEN
jgi:hypothetical protein